MIIVWLDWLQGSSYSMAWVSWRIGVEQSRDLIWFLRKGLHVQCLYLICILFCFNLYTQDGMAHRLLDVMHAQSINPGRSTHSSNKAMKTYFYCPFDLALESNQTTLICSLVNALEW